MTGFAKGVDEFWQGTAATAATVYSDDALTVIVDPTVQETRRVSIVRPVVGAATVILSPAVAEGLGLGSWADFSEPRVLAALADAGIELHNADNLFYFDRAASAELITEPDAPAVRKLAASHATAFARFGASASEQDREDSFVELDHWAVFGAFDGDQLVAAASAYPWGGAKLADIGVLTLAEFRGRGFARQVVRALSRFALNAGYEPQYRCQLDNLASIALAKSTGLTLYGTWQVVSADPVATD